MAKEGYAVKEVTTTEAQVARFRQDIQEKIRVRIREAIEVVVQEELTEALGTGSYERSDQRRGYRNGFEERTVTTEAGTRQLRIPRGRITHEDGTTSEFRSEILPRYARRTRAIDEAMLGIYLAGANTRRIRKALTPLLGDQHLSKSAVSRVVGRLKALFQAWNERDLSEEQYPIIYLDAIHLKIRLARRVVSVPVLAVLGVAKDGRKVLVALRIATSEAASHWGGVLIDLQRRGLAAPRLLIVDGHTGLRKALKQWPGAQVQRCTEHKRANLKEHCPVHARAEMKRDYNRIVRAANGLAARKAYDTFVSKWSTLCPAVARSLEEAGDELLTFYEFPKSMWRSLRTTNPLENLNREFRRRTKTQGSFSTEDAAITLLYGLVAFDQIRMHKIDGHHEVKNLIVQMETEAA
jgi:transposase-like protein